jgi:hypothetical protein
MKMGLQDVSDIHTQGTRLGDVEIYITPGIDHCTGILAG